MKNSVYSYDNECFNFLSEWQLSSCNLQMSGKHNKAGIKSLKDFSNLFTSANLMTQITLALYVLHEKETGLRNFLAFLT